MRHKSVAGVVVVLGLAMFCLMSSTTTVAEEPERPSGRYGVEVEFDVSPNGGTYTCTAIVSDLVNDEVVAAPRVTAAIGEEAVVRSSIQGDKTNLEIVLTFLADTTNATYMLEVTQEGNLIAKQKSSVKL